MVRFIIHDWERLEYKQLVTDVGFSVERSNHDQIFIKPSPIFFYFFLHVLIWVCWEIKLILLVQELSMKMVSGKTKSHRGTWLSWNLNDTTTTKTFHEVTSILIISWWSHILTPGCSRDQSVAEVQNLLLLLWEIVHQRFFICWCFYVRQCYLQRTVLQALLWWMFPWWNKGGEMAV